MILKRSQSFQGFEFFFVRRRVASSDYRNLGNENLGIKFSSGKSGEIDGRSLTASDWVRRELQNG
jgi:hypothetical protein